MQFLVLERMPRLRHLSAKCYAKTRGFSTVSQRLQRTCYLRHSQGSLGYPLHSAVTASIYSLRTRKRRLTALYNLQQRGFAIIDSDIYEPDTLKTRFYNICHQVTVSFLIALCLGGIGVVIFLSVKLHTQGKKVKMAAMRSRSLKTF